MEDNELKSIFDNFNPGLSSDSGFMDKLEQNLKAVEMVKSHVAAVQKKNRIALLVAAITGFIFGVLSAVFYPVALDFVMRLSVLSAATPQIVMLYGNYITLIAMCLIGGIITYSAYDLTQFATRVSVKPLRLSDLSQSPRHTAV